MSVHCTVYAVPGLGSILLVTVCPYTGPISSTVLPSTSLNKSDFLFEVLNENKQALRGSCFQKRC